MDGTNEKLIFVGVTFENYSKVYHYLCDGDDLDLFDIVLVPVGMKNEIKEAVVSEKLFCDESDAPFPPSQAKMVIDKIYRDRFDPSVDFLKKCLYKPVKLIYSNFYNLSGIVKLVAETPEGKTYLRLLHKEGEITVPVKNLKFVIPSD